MILTRVSDYLRHHRRASVGEIAGHLQVAPAALTGMLEMLERKGRVRRLPGNASCGSCCKCDPESVTHYEWHGA